MGNIAKLRFQILTVLKESLKQNGKGNFLMKSSLILILYINGNWVCYVDITRLTSFVLLLSGSSCSNVDSANSLEQSLSKENKN